MNLPLDLDGPGGLALLRELAGPAVETGVVAVFAVVYLGMFLGGLPRLKLDRTGVALLGAIAMIALTGMSLEEAARAVDLPTLVLLFAFMVVSAQMRLGGFYAAVALRVGALQVTRPLLLALMMGVAAALAAVFSNDVVCLAMTPVVARIAIRRRMNPVPWLVGLACAANLGSAATLIGNPQNMLIGSVLKLSFAQHLQQAWLPVLLSLGALWLWLAFGPGARSDAKAGAYDLPPDDDPPFDRLQSIKGLLVAGTLMAVFLLTDWPHGVAALVGAAVLLMSRQLHSSQVMGYVDWQLLLLFIGLFIVNHAFGGTGLGDEAVAWLAGHGVRVAEPGVLLVLGVTLSNLVSNVPAVMLLLPHLKDAPPDIAVLLALATTFAGNLLLVGSIANLIVVDLADKAGVRIGWREHATIGVPVTLMSLVVLALWLWLGR